MADKELKYLRRDPFFKITLMNIAYMIVVAVFSLVLAPWRRDLGPGTTLGGALSFWSLWGASAFLLFGMTSFVFNLWGIEGGAAGTLFLFPADRRAMLVGKNLVLFVALSLVNVAALSVLCGVGRRLDLLGPMLCWAILALVVMMAVGNMVSVQFPYRVVLKGWKVQSNNVNKGCAYGLLYLLATLVALALLVPVLAALIVPTVWVSSAWLALSIPLAAAYAVGLYLLSLHLATRLLIEREQTVIERLTQTE